MKYVKFRIMATFEEGGKWIGIRHKVSSKMKIIIFKIKLDFIIRKVVSPHKICSIYTEKLYI